jgi:hypothetical protein
MDEMKQSSQIEDTLREIARQRDKLLSKVPTLSPARRAALTDFLVGEFPVEAALREAATKRDQLLNLRPPEIPASVESRLHRQLGPVAPPRDGVLGPVWLRPSRSPLGAVLTVCVMIAAAILCFGRWGTPTRRSAQNFPHSPRPDGVNAEILDRSPIGRAELFTPKASIGPFNLNTNERASLQASFLGNSSLYLADGTKAFLGLRLDLPVRAILIEDGLARTP